MKLPENGTGYSCVVCGAPIRGDHFYLQARDARFCRAHRNLPRCTFCGLPAGYRMEEINYCAVCRRDAVSDDRAVNLAQKSMVQLRRLGLKFAVKPGFSLASRSPRSGDITGHSILGWTNVTTVDNRISDIQIIVRRHMPAMNMIATFVHEVGHAYACTLGVKDEYLEEGFCEALAYYHLSMHVPNSELVVHQIAGRSDSYGEAFRACSTVIRRHGFPALITKLQTANS